VARQPIAGADRRPLAQLAGLLPALTQGPVIFHCLCGWRTAMNAERLAACVSCAASLLEGGLEAWQQAGLPACGYRALPRRHWN